MSDEKPKKDYEVGYGKPPRRTQFQPGQSGNPKGRPKKTKDLQKLFEQELSRNLRITENGQMKILPVREAFVKSTVNAALKGDRNARQIVLAHMKEQLDVDGLEIDAAAEAMLQEFMKQHASEEGNDDEPKSQDDQVSLPNPT